MTLTRRRVVGLGGGFVAALSFPRFAAGAPDIVDIEMRGRRDGSLVWFDPAGVFVEPGQTVRWTNRDPGNSHTTTAYHPANFDRPLRVPEDAEPWNSGYLLPDQSFSVMLTAPGVYDFYCVPHEHAGMVGRLVVGGPELQGWSDAATASQGIPEAALANFPSTADILEKGAVRLQ